MDNNANKIVLGVLAALVAGLLALVVGSGACSNGHGGGAGGGVAGGSAPSSSSQPSNNAGGNTNTVVLSDDVVVYDPDSSSFTILSADDNSVTVSSIDGLSVGSIINAGVTDATPDGLLRRVEAVEEQNGTYRLSTRPAALTEAIDECGIHVVVEIDEDGNYVIQEDGTGLANPFVQQAFAADFTYAFDVLDKTENFGPAKAAMKDAIEMDIKISWGDIDIKVVNHFLASLTIDAKRDEKSDDVELFNKPLRTIDIPIGVFHIVLTNDLTISANAESHISGLTMFQESTIDKTLGYRYVSGNNLEAINEDNSNTPGMQFSADSAGEIFSISGGAGVKATLGSRLYGLAGVDLAVALQSDIGADLQKIPAGVSDTGALVIPGLGWKVAGNWYAKVYVPINGNFVVENPLNVFDDSDDPLVDQELFSTNDTFVLYEDGGSWMPSQNASSGSGQSATGAVSSFPSSGSGGNLQSGSSSSSGLAGAVPSTPSAPRTGTGLNGAANVSGDLSMSLVFDISGSMDESSALGISKLASAQRQSSDFISTLRNQNANGTLSSQTGVASFSDTAWTDCELTADYDKVLAAINNLYTIGMTNMTAGLAEGISQLEVGDGARLMVFLSDGLNNEGGDDADVLRQAQKAADAGIVIHTVGFGPQEDIDEGLLRDIAAITGGSYSYEDSTTNLPSAAVGLYASMLGAQLAATSNVLYDTIGTVQQGQTVDVGGFTISKNGSLRAYLYWPGSTLDLQLVDPDGITVDAGYPGYAIDTSTIPTAVTIANAKQGDWTMAVYGRETSMENEPFYTIAALDEVADTAPAAGGGSSNSGTGLMMIFLVCAAAAIVGVFAFSKRKGAS